MCTAYELGKRGGTFPDRVTARAAATLLDLDETPRIIRPTIPSLVLMPDGELKEMVWGFRRPVPGGKTKQLWRTIVNSREDKLDGRMWKKAFHERRCLIPAAGFYEWVDKAGGKVPLRFQDPSEGFLWIAGIWELDQERGECFSMITTEPTTAIEPVHDRMPAVLTHQQTCPYLDGDLHEFGPSRASLIWAEAENFLKGKKGGKSVEIDPVVPPPRPPEQTELF